MHTGTIQDILWPTVTNPKSTWRMQFTWTSLSKKSDTLCAVQYNHSIVLIYKTLSRATCWSMHDRCIVQLKFNNRNFAVESLNFGALCIISITPANISEWNIKSDYKTIFNPSKNSISYLIFGVYNYIAESHPEALCSAVAIPTFVFFMKELRVNFLTDIHFWLFPNTMNLKIPGVVSLPVKQSRLSSESIRRGCSPVSQLLILLLFLTSRCKTRRWFAFHYIT